MHRFSRFFPLCVLATACHPVVAGTARFDAIGLDEGNAAALLETTSHYYVEAMHKLISDKYRGAHRAIRWERLETAMSEAKLARFEYRYVRNRVPAVRVYHAMSGGPISTVAGSVFDGPTPVTTPTSPDVEDWSDVEGELPAGTGFDLGEAAALDAADEAYFAGFDATDVRARISTMESPTIGRFSVPGQADYLDAEMKILRNIERDIVSGTIPAGGSVQGFVSGMACVSCKVGTRSLAEAHDLDVRISQFYTTLSGADETAAIAAGTARLRGGILVDATSGAPMVAKDVLTAARKAQIRRLLSPGSMDRSFKGTLWRQRSFKLLPPRLPSVADSPETRPSYLDNPDIGEPPPPQC